MDSCDIFRNNKYITVEGKRIFYQEWFDKGTLCIQDFFDEKSNMLAFKDFQIQFDITTIYNTFV